MTVKPHAGRFRRRRTGHTPNMSKWRYALLGWIAWKLIKRRTRQKLDVA
jgi:hypothetical protein